MSKIWHLTLTRATHAPQVTFRNVNGGEVTLTRGKVTMTTIDLGSTLNSSLIRVIRVEEKHKEVKGAGNRTDAVQKNIKPLPKPKPVVEEPPPVPVVGPLSEEPAPVVVEEPAPVVAEEPAPAVAEPAPAVAEEPAPAVEEKPAKKEEKVEEPAPVEEAPKPTRKRTTRKRTTRKRTTKKSEG